METGISSGLIGHLTRNQTFFTFSYLSKLMYQLSRVVIENALYCYVLVETRLIYIKEIENTYRVFIEL